MSIASTKKKSRIAVAMYGQPRHCDNLQVFASILREIVSQYETVDFYCHTWSGPASISTWAQQNGSIDPGIPENPISTINNLYQPIAITVDTPITIETWENIDDVYENLRKYFPNYEHLTKQNLVNMKSQFISKRKALELIQTNNIPRHYDFVILTRYDGILRGLPDLDNIQHSNNMENIIVPVNGDLNDTIMISDKTHGYLRDTMENAESILNDDRIDYSNWKLPIPELYQKAFLDEYSHGINIIKHKPLYSEVVRKK